MKVHYIYHSCYLVELENHALLFDYFEGKLPEINKPLYVFSSHFHEDHFSKKIFDLDANAFILSKDIKKKRKRQVVKESIFIKENETIQVDDLTIHTLNSTDEGVAFIIEVEGKTIYHAGDLNDWAWLEEGNAWLEEQETNYQAYLKPLKDYDLDVAFVLLDPRLEETYAKGMVYFMENYTSKHVFPMHMWKQYDYCKKFIKEYPMYSIYCLTDENQEFEI